MLKSAIAGILAFVAIAVLAGLGVFSWQHFTLVNQLRNVVTGQCLTVEQGVIDAAVDKAVAEATETEEEEEETETKTP